jgi:hypothetical protein
MAASEWVAATIWGQFSLRLERRRYARNGGYFSTSPPRILFTSGEKSWPGRATRFPGAAAGRDLLFSRGAPAQVAVALQSSGKLNNCSGKPIC